MPGDYVIYSYNICGAIRARSRKEHTMPCWQDLYELLMDGELSPHEIMARLNVRPSRLRRMLASKRLAARLAMAEAISAKSGGHAVVARAGEAARKLACLIDADRPETARKACLDVLQTARGIYREAKSQGGSCAGGGSAKSGRATAPPDADRAGQARGREPRRSLVAEARRREQFRKEIVRNGGQVLARRAQLSG